MGINSQAACLADGLTDDYESLHGELHNELHKDETLLYVYDSGIPRGGWHLIPHLDSTGLRLLLLKAVK